MITVKFETILSEPTVTIRVTDTDGHDDTFSTDILSSNSFALHHARTNVREIAEQLGVTLGPVLADEDRFFRFGTAPDGSL